MKIPSKNNFNKNAATTIEYATLMILITAAIIIMGRYVIYSWYADLRDTDKETIHTFTDPLLKHPPGSLDVDCNCQMVPPTCATPPCCGLLGCLETEETALYQECKPFGCKNPKAECVDNKECCGPWLPTGKCGQPDCVPGKGEFIRYCGEGKIEKQCKVDPKCNTKCVGVIPGAIKCKNVKDSNGNLVDALDEYGVTVNTPYKPVAQCTAGSQCEMMCDWDNYYYYSDEPIPDCYLPVRYLTKKATSVGNQVDKNCNADLPGYVEIGGGIDTGPKPCDGCDPVSAVSRPIDSDGDSIPNELTHWRASTNEQEVTVQVICAKKEFFGDITVRTYEDVIGSGSYKTIGCPNGTFLTSGGFKWETGGNTVDYMRARPKENGNVEWEFGGDDKIYGYITCITPHTQETKILDVKVIKHDDLNKPTCHNATLVKCPAGYYAVGGGVANKFTTGSLLNCGGDGKLDQIFSLGHYDPANTAEPFGWKYGLSDYGKDPGDDPAKTDVEGWVTCIKIKKPYPDPVP